MEITIHDIAKQLNISASTVSRALKNNPIISESTRKRIKKTAEEMGYRPNVLAASFRTKKTNTIGVIVPLINRHFFSSVISGIEDIAYKNGFTVTISQSNDKVEKEAKIAHTLFANRVDGLILSLGMETKSFEHLKLFTDRKVPLVLFDRITEKIDAHKIIVDDFGGAYRATKHLIEIGARKIAHIGGPQTINIYKSRQEGFIAALNDAGLKTDKSLIFNGTMTRNDGVEALKTLRKNNKLPDAVFCANDTTALGIIIYLKEIGIKLPDEIAIVGFSNEPFSEVVTPSISTIKQPGFLMGQKAAELVISQINNETSGTNFKTITMPTQLIIRNSSKK